MGDRHNLTHFLNVQNSNLYAANFGCLSCAIVILCDGLLAISVYQIVCRTVTKVAGIASISYYALSSPYTILASLLTTSIIENLVMQPARKTKHVYFELKFYLIRALLGNYNGVPTVLQCVIIHFKQEWLCNIYTATRWDKK